VSTTLDPQHTAGGTSVSDEAAEAPRPYRRQRRHNDRWHSCSSCPQWPTSYYTEHYARPARGPLCAFCVAQERRGTCGADQISHWTRNGTAPSRSRAG